MIFFSNAAFDDDLPFCFITLFYKAEIYSWMFNFKNDIENKHRDYLTENTENYGKLTD